MVFTREIKHRNRAGKKVLKMLIIYLFTTHSGKDDVSLITLNLNR